MNKLKGASPDRRNPSDTSDVSDPSEKTRVRHSRYSHYPQERLDSLWQAACKT